MKTLVLAGKDLEKILTMELAIPAVEKAFAAHGRGEAVMPPKLYLPMEKYAGDFRAMPSLLGDAAGVKWVNMHPENPKRFNLPAVMGVYILSDPETAFPLAVMDGTRLTSFRTGAAAAVASKYLAVKTPATVGFIGCGVQARKLLAAHRALYSGFRAVMADVSAEAAEKFAKEAGGFAASVDQAGSCDIICTSTPSRAPVLHRSYVGISTHINAMGADAPGKQELDTALLKKSRVVVDEWGQASHAGEINVAVEKAGYARKDIAGQLGEILAGGKPGRTGAADITIFDSTGLAIQDVSVARLIYDKAVKLQKGQVLQLHG